MVDKEEQRPAKRGALGKGLNSLLGLGGEPEEPASYEAKSTDSVRGCLKDQVLKISVLDIEVNPHQPRKIFKEEELRSLAESIKIDGIIQPVIVSLSAKPGKFILIAGERRWRAAQMVGLPAVPAIVRNVEEDDRLRVALIENIQRSALNPIEEAEAYYSLVNDFGLTQEQCAVKVGKDRVSIANTLRLLALPKEVQIDIKAGRITTGHGKALLAIDGHQLIMRARDIIIKKSLNVRQAEQLCRKIKDGGDPAKDSLDKPANPDLTYLAENLRSHLRTKVKLSGSGSRGRIEISYFSASELERILAVIGGKEFI